MKKILGLMAVILICPSLLFAGVNTLQNWLRLLPVDGRVYLDGTRYIDGDDTNSEIDIPFNVNITGSLKTSASMISTPPTAIIVDTGTVITSTEQFVILNATGTSQTIKPFADTPILSTSTYTNGTVITLICEEGSIVLDNNANQAIGADITLGANDLIMLYLNGSVWTRITSTDN